MHIKASFLILSLFFLLSSLSVASKPITSSNSKDVIRSLISKKAQKIDLNVYFCFGEGESDSLEEEELLDRSKSYIVSGSIQRQKKLLIPLKSYVSEVYLETWTPPNIS